MSLGFVPALPAEFGNLLAETGDGALNSMPVCVPLLLHYSMIVAFEHFPAKRERSLNLK